MRLGTAHPARGAGVFVVELPAPLADRADRARPASGSGSSASPDLRSTGCGRRRVRSPLGWPRSGCRRSRSSTSGPTDASVAARVGAMERDDAGRPPAVCRRALAPRAAMPADDPGLVGRDRRGRGVRGCPAERVRRRRSRQPSGRRLPTRPVVLPFANLRRPTGERRPTGLAGSLLPEPVVPRAATDARVVVPDGDAEGARGEPPAPPKRRGPTVPRQRRTTDATAGRGRPPRTRARRSPRPRADRLQAELAELTGTRRPEVIARIRAAKEFGDLKENADYTAAREEQSFLEGRIQSIEARLRDAVIAEAPPRRRRRCRPRIDRDRRGRRASVTTRSSARPRRIRRPAACRSHHPSGGRSLGATVGSTVTVDTPRGAVDYTVSRDRVGRAGRVSPWGRRPSCARPRTAPPGSATRGRACPGCSRRRCGPSAR